MRRRNRNRQTRSLREYQRQRRLEWLNETLHNIAVLEGRLAGPLNVRPAEVADHLGISTLPPWERLDVLLKVAAEYGV